MRASIALFVLLSASAPLTACGIDDPSADGDVAGDGDGKADGTTKPTSGYYQAAWGSGGLQVSRVNRSSTRCLDGSVRSTCTVFAIDWTPTGLSREELARYPQPPLASDSAPSVPLPIIVKGYAEQRGDLTFLVATELWVGGSAAGTGGGTVVLATQNGSSCVAVTCPKYNEHELNAATTVALAQVRLEDAHPHADDLLMAKDLLDYTRYGVIVAGDRYTVTDGTTEALGRTAHQYYLRAPVPLSW